MPKQDQLNTSRKISTLMFKSTELLQNFISFKNYNYSVKTIVNRFHYLKISG
ncbi:hypothetical protein HanIR_Chr12g0579841 [Helianthus annuus]|nr:hypothetical protein HanIR_Chr12g0579841 [Helianthus annuus]